MRYLKSADLIVGELSVELSVELCLHCVQVFAIDAIDVDHGFVDVVLVFEAIVLRHCLTRCATPPTRPILPFKPVFTSS